MENVCSSLDVIPLLILQSPIVKLKIVLVVSQMFKKYVSKKRNVRI